MGSEDGTIAGISWPAGRVVVVSPHLDDAALSLGGLIAAAARRGRHATVLTVLAGDLGSRLPAGGWDRRAGFETEGDAARGRREEDRRACEILGAEPVWLPFPDSQYPRPRQAADVLEAVRSAVADADAVLLPGYPLSHRDHAWVTEVLLRGRLAARVGLYAEQPYAFRLGSGSTQPANGVELPVHPASWVRAQPSLSDRVRKVRAVRSYRTQLPMLGLSQRGHARLVLLLSGRNAEGREEVGWMEGATGPAR